MKKLKLCNETILELLQIYGAVKTLLVVMFGLLRGFCDCSYHLSDSWVPFAEIKRTMIAHKGAMFFSL